MSSPEKSIQEQLIVALDCIEKTLSNKTYMTRLRIVEILEKRYPELKNNFYLSQPNALLFLLLGLQKSGNIEMIPGSNIYRSDPYEESNYEPILYEDIPEEQLRTFFNEICFGVGLTNGKSYSQINDELMSHTQTTVLQMIHFLKERGVTHYNVFYRRIDAPRRRATHALPVLPVTVY